MCVNNSMDITRAIAQNDDDKMQSKLNYLKRMQEIIFKVPNRRERERESASESVDLCVPQCFVRCEACVFVTQSQIQVRIN